MNQPITTASGTWITLGEIAEIEYGTTLPSISRQDGQFITTVSATTTQDARSGASKAISRAFQDLSLPAGVAEGRSAMDKMSDEETSQMGTTLTTVISMIPMIFSSSSGMAMMKGMGYIVIGGLVASTILTMFLMRTTLGELLGDGYTLLSGAPVDMTESSTGPGPFTVGCAHASVENVTSSDPDGNGVVTVTAQCQKCNQTVILGTLTKVNDGWTITYGERPPTFEVRASGWLTDVQ